MNKQREIMLLLVMLSASGCNDSPDLGNTAVVCTCDCPPNDFGPTFEQADACANDTTEAQKACMIACDDVHCGFNHAGLSFGGKCKLHSPPRRMAGGVRNSKVWQIDPNQSLIALTRNGATDFTHPTGTGKFTGGECPGQSCAIEMNLLNLFANDKTLNLGDALLRDIEVLSDGATSGTFIGTIKPDLTFSFDRSTVLFTATNAQLNFQGHGFTHASAEFFPNNDLGGGYDPDKKFMVLQGHLVQAGIPDKHEMDFVLQGPIVSHPPVVSLGGDITAECNTTTTLTGTVSDRDNDVTQFLWKLDGQVVSTAQTLTTKLPTSTHTLRFAALDSAGNDGADQITLRVEDHVPPDIQCPHPQVECTGPSRIAVAFSPTASDTCSPVTTSCAPPSGTTFPLGNTPFTCTAIDAAGNSETCHSAVTVVDTQPPTIASIAPSETVLWPPNHRMVPVSFAVSVADVCDPSPACTIASISSNEPINGTGDGNTAPDWEILGGLQANLRAERAGNGTGRRYTISVRCVDGSGNASSGTAVVTVPKSR